MALHPDGQRVLLACAQADLFPSVPTNSIQLVEYTFVTGRLRLLSQKPDHKPIDGTLLPDVLYAPGTLSILFAIAPSPAAEVGPDEWPGVFLAAPEPADPIRQPQPALSQQAGSTSRHASVAVGASTSDDRRFVLFHSLAGDLGSPVGVDRSQNLYLRDRTAGTTTLITPPISPEADHRGVILDASMSGDASRVVFASSRPDLVSNDGNEAFDVFLWTRSTGQLRAISSSRSGTGTAANVPRPTTLPAGSVRPFLQRDGAAIVFESTSRDLIPNEPQNTARFEVYRHDLALGVTEFISYRPNPNRYAGQATRYSRMSDDGSIVAFAHDVSTTSGGVPVLYRPETRSWTPLFPAGPVVDTFISQTGNHVGFLQRPTGATTGRNLVIWNTATTNVVFSLPIGAALLKNLHFSADGNAIAFSTTASLHIADTNQHSDVYLIRLTDGVPVLISSSPSGFAANGISDQPALSSDGSRIAFRSRATDLTADPASGTGDLFLRDMKIGKTRRILDSPSPGSPALHPVFTGGGSVLLFTSASGFHPTDRNDTHDVFRLEFSDAPAPVQVRIVASPAGGWQLRWTGHPSVRYQAESTELLDQGWAPVGGAMTGAGTDLVVEDARPATQTRFYRVILLP
jgi:Tol biopolymer transport system component